MWEVEAARVWLATAAQVICALLLAVVLDSTLRGTLRRVPSVNTRDRWQVHVSWRIDGWMRLLLIAASGLTVIFDVMALATPPHLVAEKLGAPMLIWNAVVMLWLVFALLGRAYLHLREHEQAQCPSDSDCACQRETDPDASGDEGIH